MKNENKCQFPLWGKEVIPRSQMNNPDNFCSEKAALGSSYCPEHHKICRVSPDPDAPKVRWNWQRERKERGIPGLNVQKPRGCGGVDA